jgi:hypothetical protein
MTIRPRSRSFRAALVAAFLVLATLPIGMRAEAQTPTVPEGNGLPQAPAPSGVASDPNSAPTGATLTVQAHRVATPFDLDGRLDESFYATTEPISTLIQVVPVEGGVPSEPTEAWISFDDDNVYVAARVWDAMGEDGWIANEMRRDALQLRQNDTFGIYFDTYNDGRNSYGFYVNAIGGFADFQITNEGTPNFDWNPVTVVRTGRFDPAKVFPMC